MFSTIVFQQLVKSDTYTKSFFCIIRIQTSSFYKTPETRIVQVIYVTLKKKIQHHLLKLMHTINNHTRLSSSILLPWHGTYNRLVSSSGNPLDSPQSDKQSPYHRTLVDILAVYHWNNLTSEIRNLPQSMTPDLSWACLKEHIIYQARNSYITLDLLRNFSQDNNGPK